MKDCSFPLFLHIHTCISEIQLGTNTWSEFASRGRIDAVQTYTDCSSSAGGYATIPTSLSPMRPMLRLLELVLKLCALNRTQIGWCFFNLLIVRKLTPLSKNFTHVLCFVLSLAAQNQKDCWGIHFQGRSCWTTGLAPAPTTPQQELKCTYHPIDSPSPPHIEQLQEQERALKMQKDAIKKVREALLLPDTWTSLTKSRALPRAVFLSRVPFIHTISRWHHVVIARIHTCYLSLSLASHVSCLFCVYLCLCLSFSHT